ncbi:alanyl (membrane) aminopeptidase-like b [Periophthalmus magnuspinnatus]|uniref:alanyl (membrane) aminopeptidase-like b n=1 Tax=Periophthalmus magnuspinnatus TaxID=409849 RepID=UPI00145C0322|nr:alanyl (membrane) aminopeptidase-like b [Periophthalmus magnuspinnatus]
MSKNSLMSKTLAAVFAILTLSVIGSLVTMVIVYNIQLQKLKPTPPPTAPVTTLAPPPEMRLREDVLPRSYQVFIHIPLYTRIIEEVNVTSPNQTFLFDGNVTVHLECVQKTKTIFLHSRNQKVFKPMVHDLNSNKQLEVRDYTLHDDQSEFLEIILNDALEVGGNYSLFLAFKGEISDSLHGLFLSSYQEGTPAHEEDTNVYRYMVATNMQPTDTRKVFPCFDEPAMKARFNLTIIHRRDTTALSNQDVADSNIIDDEWQYTRFQPTEVMSPYLFAFTVSEFKAKDTYPPSKIKTYARPEAVDAGHTAYADSITGNILHFYQNYFDIRYTQKLDQIAMPDLAPLGMENWGLVTYQEWALLYEEGVSSHLHKEMIASLIAHELAHQWFGNMVTMKWWNELWLNEGFANYMSYLAVDKVAPAFKMSDKFIANELHSAFEADALTSSHPLTLPAAEVQTPDEIMEMFDRITYSKGAVVLKMLADVLGESVFQKGIKIYLERFRLKNTDQYDLWDAMQMSESESGGFVDVKTLMDTWTNQIGYPVITINTNSGEVYQKQFLLNDTSESNLLWEIPVRVKSGSGQSALEWILFEKVQKDTFISKKGEWILANVNCTGYYRVNYDLTNWQRLLNEIETNPGGIPLLNRGQLIDDAFNLARAQLVSVSLALNSTRFLSNETEYIPWQFAEKNLDYFVLMFDRSEVYGPMQKYLQNQVTALYNYYKNYTDNSTVPPDPTSQSSQILAVKLACSNGLPECVNMAKSMFKLWMTNNTNRIHPNLRSVIYCQALAAGGLEEWEFAWDRFQNTSDISEKDHLREALACTKKIWLLNRYLDYTLNPDKIRLMDVSSVITSIAYNEAGHALAWNFIRANWNYISKLYAGEVITEITQRFSTPFELQELERFSTTYDLGYLSRVVQRAIEQTKVNIQWVKENRETVLNWFLAEIS